MHVLQSFAARHKIHCLHSLHCLHAKGGGKGRYFIQGKKTHNNMNIACKRKQLTRHKYKICKRSENTSAVKLTFQAEDTKLNVLPKPSRTQAGDEVYEMCHKISFHAAILSNLSGTKNIKSQKLFKNTLKYVWKCCFHYIIINIFTSCI